MQNSEVFGSRLTLRTPLGESGNTELVWGGDYNQERSDMPLDVFDPAAYDASGGLVFDKIGKLTYMPPLRTRSAGAFAQLQHRFDEHWSIDGGLRYEYSTAEFDDFVPLSESKAASPVTVKGGDPTTTRCCRTSASSIRRWLTRKSMPPSARASSCPMSASSCATPAVASISAPRTSNR